MSEISLEINGIAYTGAVSASASKSMEHISGEFSFEISLLDDLQKFPLKLNDKCRILIDGVPFITGYIEKAIVEYNGSEHKITVSGRDKTCDVVDSTLGDITFTAGISLQDIIKKVLKTLNLQDEISISSNVEIPVFDSTEINNISSQVGETAFEFIVKYAKKRQVLVMSDGNGNIVLARKPNDDEKIKTVLTTENNFQGTIVNASIDYDSTKRFYKYILKSQSNPVSSIVEDVGEIDNNQVVSVEAIAYDNEVRRSRVLNLLQHDDSYNNKADLQERAIWEANYRKSTGFTYNITVQGFHPLQDQNIIWKPNLLVLVLDKYCDISEETLLLVRSVKFNYSINGGSTTTLELIDKDGYSVEILQGVKYRKKRGHKAVGSNIISDLSALSGT